MLVALVVTAFGGGVHLPGNGGRVDPTKVAETPPFDKPGLVQTGPGHSGPEHAPTVLDRWRPWRALAALLIIIAYGPNLVRLAVTTPFNTPGLRVW